MASIQGLTEHQNSQLAGAQVGQLIFIEKFEMPAQCNESGDEDNEAFDEDAGEGADEENESGGEDESSSQAGDHGSSEQADQEDGESDEEADGTDDTSLDETSSFPPTMYVVTGITKNEVNSITDLRITELTYADKVSVDHSYHIYGEQCETHYPTDCGSDCKDTRSITEIVDSDNFSFSMSPHGDKIRRHIASNPTRQCINNCRRGFLDDINSLPGMIKHYVVPTLSWGSQLPAFLQPPVCPVCMGQDLLKEQQDLQIRLLNMGQINGLTLLEDIHEYHSALARRWAALGLPFKQFDEREWGYHFEDMLSDDDDGGDDDGRFEHWEEAMDPSNNAPLRPASDATIAQLPRRPFKDVVQSLETTTCMICQEGVREETVMVELPCGHVEFCEECVIKWLKNYDNCPKCRAKVTSIEDEEVDSNTQAAAPAPVPAAAPIRPHIPNDDHYSSINGLGMSGDDAIAAAIAASMAGVPPEQPGVEAQAEVEAEVEMDGDDSIMSDA